MAASTRVLLFPVDDSDDSQRAFEWMLANFFKDGDEVHLLNVISRLQFAATLGVPAVDFTPQINREAYEAVVRKAEAFIVKRFLARLPPHIQTTPIVHIIKVRGGGHRPLPALPCMPSLRPCMRCNAPGPSKQHAACSAPAAPGNTDPPPSAAASFIVRQLLLFLCGASTAQHRWPARSPVIHAQAVRSPSMYRVRRAPPLGNGCLHVGRDPPTPRSRHSHPFS